MTNRAAHRARRQPRCLGALCVVGVASFVWVAVQVFTAAPLAVDGAARAFAQQRSTPALTAAMQAITVLGSVSVAPALVLMALAAVRWPALRGFAVPILVAAAGAGLLDEILKLLLPRARPMPFFGIAPSALSSFPSGHALFAVSLYGTLAWQIASRLTGACRRACVWVGASVLILAVGSSRVCLGVHYLSDVLAGYAAGIAWASAVLLAASARTADRFAPAPGGRGPTRTPAPR